METKLTLPNKTNVIGASSDFAFKWSLHSGLCEDRAVRLAIAVSEVVTDIVRFAFGRTQGEFEISFYSSPGHVELIIHEFGIPFDPERHQYNAQKAVSEGDYEGAGLELIKHLVDDFLFLNKGRKGIEFRLVQNKRDLHIARMYEPEELIDETPPPDLEYFISEATPEDAEEISKIIYKTYGHTYYKDNSYYPKKIEWSLQNNDKFAVITKTKKGESVGYFAVVFSTDSNIGEVGEAVVLVHHRRRGIMKMMLKKLIDIARERSLLGLFGTANASHLFSQRANARFNMETTALIVAMYPRLRIEGMDACTQKQPVSAVLDFVFLDGNASKEMYLPPRYKAILIDIFESLNIEPIDREITDETFQGTTDVDVHIKYAAKHAVVVIKEYGLKILDLIEQTEKDLHDNEIQSIYIDLPVHLPETKLIAENLVERGYIFSGLMPLFHQELDYIRFQKLPPNLDFSIIQTYSPMANRLKELINKEYDSQA